MNYSDYTSEPLVVAQTDGYDQALVLKAAEQFYASRDSNIPVISWNSSQRGFTARPPKALEGIPDVSLRSARSLLEALKGIEHYNGEASFVLMVPPGDANNPSLALGRQLQTMALKIHAPGTKIRKVALLFCSCPPTPLTDDLHFGSVDVAEEAPQASSSFETTSGVVRPEDISRVLNQPAQALGKPWPFADDPQWMDWIDSLNLDGVQELARKGLHLASAKRLREALQETQKRFLHRNHALEMMVACAIARANIVYLGPPGTAKSLLVRTFSQALGVSNFKRPIAEEDAAVREALDPARNGARSQQNKRRMFEYLLTRYTTPEELFGGTDIQVLLNGNVHARRTGGMLPQAEIAFLDEIFKANSAILNTMLSLTNERIFFNLGQAFKVNLAFIVGASNESPDLGELGALFDRFPMRVPCHPTPDAEVSNLIQMSHKFAIGEMLHTRDEIPRKACLNDIRLLTKVVMGGVYGGADALPPSQASDLFCDLFQRMRQDFGVSDRTPAQILRVSRALALLDDGNPVNLEARHLRTWGYVAPSYKESRALQRFVQQQIQGLEPQAANLFDES